MRVRFTEVDVRDGADLRTPETVSHLRSKTRPETDELSTHPSAVGAPRKLRDDMCNLKRMPMQLRGSDRTCWEVCAARNCFQYLPSAVSLSVRAGNCLMASFRYSAGFKSMAVRLHDPSGVTAGPALNSLPMNLLLSWADKYARTGLPPHPVSTAGVP